MPAETHILPFAAVAGMRDFFAASGAALALPQLDTLLAHMAPSHWLRLPEDAFMAPHEAAWLHAAWPSHGLPAHRADAQPPLSLAALMALQHGHPVTTEDGWALVTPCHLQITTDSITLLDPALLAVTADEHAAVRDAIAALWAEDGLALTVLPQGPWLARADWLRGLATPSPDRAIGGDVRAWMPELARTSLLQRLQTEAQMLLYDHPVNDARAARRQPAINALWISGTGVLPTQPDEALATLPHIHVHDGLRPAALAGDFRAWASRWQQWDAEVAPQLLAQLQAGQTIHLVLAGEQQAVTLAPALAGLWPRLQATLRRWRRKDAALPLLMQL